MGFESAAAQLISTFVLTPMTAIAYPPNILDLVLTVPVFVIGQSQHHPGEFNALMLRESDIGCLEN